MKSVRKSDSINNSPLTGLRLKNRVNEYIEEMEHEEHIDDLVEQGLWDKNLTEDEARRNFVGLGVSFAMPMMLKYGSIAANANKVNNSVAELLKAGNAMDKGGLTAVGRALQKHGSRVGSIFPKASGNVASINSQGEAVLNGILTKSNATSTIRHHARFGKILEYRIPGGQGARFSADGKTFIGFLE